MDAGGYGVGGFEISCLRVPSEYFILVPLRERSTVQYILNKLPYSLSEEIKIITLIFEFSGGFGI